MPRVREALTDEQRQQLDDYVLSTGTLSRDKLFPFAQSIGVSQRVLMDQYLKPMPAWQQMRPNPPRERFGMLTSVLVDEPYKYLQADTAHLATLAANNGGRPYALVVVDMFSKRVWIIPMRTVTVREVTDAFEELLNSFPANTVSVVQTDNGVEFGPPLTALLEAWGIKHLRGKPGVPQTNGGAEAAVKSVKRAIHTWVMLNGQRAWSQAVDEIEAGLNERVHSTTGVPPEELDAPADDIDPELLDFARLRTSIALRRTAKKRNVGLPDLQVGDLVRVALGSDKNPLSKSWELRWSPDTYTIRAVHYLHRGLGIRLYTLDGFPRRRYARRLLQKVAAPVGLAPHQFRVAPAPVAEQRQAQQTAEDAAAFLARNPPLRVSPPDETEEDESGGGPARPARVRRPPARYM